VVPRIIQGNYISLFCNPLRLSIMSQSPVAARKPRVFNGGPKRNSVQNRISTVAGFDHQHSCQKCGSVYIHSHPHSRNRVHRQFPNQCPEVTCAWYHGGTNPTTSRLVPIVGTTPVVVVNPTNLIQPAAPVVVASPINLAPANVQRAVSVVPLVPPQATSPVDQSAGGGGTPKDTHSSPAEAEKELQAYLLMEAFMAPRTPDTARGLMRKAVSYVAREYPDLKPTIVSLMAGRCVARAMLETEVEKPIRKLLGSVSATESLQRAHALSKGVFERKAGLCKRLLIGTVLFLLRMVASVVCGALVFYARELAVEFGCPTNIAWWVAYALRVSAAIALVPVWKYLGRLAPRGIVEMPTR
jgi:hypothetical protein